MRIAAAAVMLVAFTGCDGRSELARSRMPDTHPGMMAMPADALRECLRFEELRPACPRVGPRTASGAFDRSLSSKEGRELWIFFAEYVRGAPKGLTARNAPPSFAHINVFAGGPVLEPEGESRRWGGRQGFLSQAPDYPQGGMEGGHLVFGWHQDGIDYSISLHAWDPLVETEETLRQMVESLP